MTSFDVYKLIRLLLPTFLREPVRIAWLESLLIAFKQQWDSYVSWRIDRIYEANVTPQTISLEAYLNRLFDAIQKRIKIKYGDEDSIYVELRGEGYDLYIDADDGLYIGLIGELSEEVKGFKVEVPAAIDAQQVSGVINRIKVVGIPYEIEII